MAIRSALRTRVEGISGRTDQTTEINNALDAALVEVHQAHAWRHENTEADAAIVSGDVSVALASGLNKLVEARLINGAQSDAMDVILKTEFVARYPSVDDYNADVPSVAYLEGETLYFFPESNGSYTIRYTYEPTFTSFASDATENPIAGTDNVLVYFAVSEALGGIGGFEASTFWFQRYERALAAAIRNSTRVIGQHLGPVVPSIPPDYHLNPWVKEQL